MQLNFDVRFISLLVLTTNLLAVCWKKLQFYYLRPRTLHHEKSALTMCFKVRHLTAEQSISEKEDKAALPWLFDWKSCSFDVHWCSIARLRVDLTFNIALYKWNLYAIHKYKSYHLSKLWQTMQQVFESCNLILIFQKLNSHTPKSLLPISQNSTLILQDSTLIL